MKPSGNFLAGLLRLRKEFDLRLLGALQGVQCGLSCAREKALADEAVRRGAYRHADDALTLLAQARHEFAAWGVKWVQDDLLPEVAEVLALGALDAGTPSHMVCSKAFQICPFVNREWRQVPEGPRYLVQPEVARSEGAPAPRWLVLVNALGIPLSFWQPFFATSSTRYRLCVVDVQPGDMFEGGIHTDADLSAYSDQYLTALRHLGVSDAVIVGWSNGGRIALDTAARGSELITEVVLLSPTLRGFLGHNEAPTAIESNLERAFESVIEDEDLADTLSAILLRSNTGAVVKQPVTAADWTAFHALPPRAGAPLLAAPVRRGEWLLNYGRRTQRDEAFPMHEVLARVTQPLTLIQGDCDNTVSNEQALRSLQNARVPLCHLLVRGAGHYVNSLQPECLWSLLEALLTPDAWANERTPLRSKVCSAWSHVA